MKIHINQIPAGGLHLEGEEKTDILDLQDELVRVLSPVRYALDIGLSDGGLFATGRLEVDLEMECVSCLERFPRTLEVADFATQVDLGGSETVDLTDALREDILLALPPHPRCDWEAGRTCPGVGKFAPKEQKLVEEEKNPWTSLDALSKIQDR